MNNSNNSNNKLTSLLSSFLTNVNKPNYEFEIRFGEYIYRDGKKHFNSSVNITFYYNVLKFLHLLNKEYSGEYLTINTTEFMFGNIKKIIDENSVSFIKKENVRKYDVYDLNIRLSGSYENKANPIEGNPDFVRLKNRESFIFDFGRFDLTTVREGNSIDIAKLNNPKYELEFEAKTNDSELIMEFIESLTKIKQGSINIITEFERFNIIKQYSNLIKGRYFIGVQPETLQRDQLSLLYKDVYSVTDKADGDRYFLFIDSASKIYYIDNNINGVIKTDYTSTKFKNTIIDGELLRKYDSLGMVEQIDFYAFDILFVDSQDLRGNNQYFLPKRLDLLEQVINSIPNNNSIFKKEFIFKDVFIGSKILLEKSRPYTNDGLIFTPVNEPYPTTKKWSKLLKWKPVEQNSIDFYSIKNGNDWDLYVQIPKENSRHNETILAKFDINKLCPDNEHLTDITFKTSFDHNLIDPTTNLPFKSHTVIEYHWDKSLKKFLPLRTRWDKTENPSKHGNFYKVACSIWNNIQNPIEPEIIFKMTNNSTLSDKSFFFEPLISSRTTLDNYLCNKYIKPNSNLLELNYKNGDNLIHYKNVDKIFGLEFSNHPISKTLNKIKSFNFKYYSFSNVSLDTLPFKSTSQFYKQIDIVYSNDINNFLQSQSSLDQLFELLECSGNNPIIIFKLINSKNIHSKTVLHNNKLVYKIECQDPSTFYNCELYINGVTDISTMYIINFDYFIKSMKEHDYILIESDSFKSCFGLDSFNKDINDIYSYCVFQKFDTFKPTILPQSIIKSINLNVINTDFTLYEIINPIDLFDILNCTTFKYNYIDFKQFDGIPCISCINQICDSLNLSFNFINNGEYKESNLLFYVNNEQLFLVLFKHNMIIPKDYFDKLLTLVELQSEQSTENIIKNKLLNDFNLEPKKTISIIKKYLSELNLKTSGSKDELLNRLLNC